MTTIESVKYIHKTREFRISYSFFGRQQFDSGVISQALDAEAREGWELVSLCPVASWNFGRTEYLLAVLRRPN